MTISEYTYNPETRVVHIETETCFCGDGTVLTRLPCPKCDGTGDGPRGGSRGCRKCWGSGRTFDSDIYETCQQCNGTTKVKGSLYSFMPKEGLLVTVVRALPIRIRRSNRGLSWNEQHLGLGALWSTTDYGDHQKLSDEELENKVRDEMVRGLHQLVNLVAASKDDNTTGTLCDGIVVDCGHNGYSVRAYWGNTVMVAPDTRSEDSGLGFGMEVYNNGGNGTLAAGLIDEATLVPMKIQ